MRISGGDAKGVKLKVPAGARPASERVRQAVFSSIAAHVPDAKILDLFCGSGAYGLEALSRGARNAVFVDDDGEAVAACRANAIAAGMKAFAEVRKMSVGRYLSGRASKDAPFDLVFADPPYRNEDRDRLLGSLEALVSADARIVVELRWGGRDVAVPPGLVVEADRRYGDTRVLMLSRLGGA